jgi:SAM-dependent methyltransferase
MTPTACIACGANQWTPLYRALVRCRACGFIRAAEIPSPEALAQIYSAAYFEGEEYADYLGDAASHVENFRRRLARITAIAAPIESLYEIGCAYGLWLQVARSAGIRVAGIDITPDGVRHAHDVLGLDATQGEFADDALTPGAWQAFCMWDTIEHLPHPEEHLAQVAAALPAGGWFFATTGDIGSPRAQREGERWRMIHPPTHLQYFSRASITRALARHGLVVRHVESTAMCRSLYGVIEGLQILGHGPARAAARLAGAVLPPGLTRRLRFTVDLGDIMLVCAQKA